MSDKSGRAPYASRPDLTRGRRFGVDESLTRSPFQRDRDRIIHSTAFRRLQHKTQVFLAHEGRHFRNRLTHTLEVSQMARSLARALGLNEDLAEAIALSHDLGHTPFGHAGERVLEEKLVAFGGFDHNLQALRVVTVLENRYAAHDGLNLSWETLEGILKHNGPVADPATIAALDKLPLPGDLEPGGHPSLEAQAAAIADDIAYNAHDIDDALRAGLLALPDLVDVPFAGPIVSEVLAAHPDVEPSRQAHEVQRRLITRAIEDVIAQTRARLAADGIGTIADVRAAGRMLVAFSPEMATSVAALKAFLFARVYRSEAVMVPVRESEAMVGALFDAYLQGAAMPGRWGRRFDHVPTDEARARTVADFVAGMTDAYARDEHARLETRPVV